MKKIIGLIAGTGLLLASCGTSNQVGGGSVFQKRTYNKGIYWNKSGSKKTETAHTKQDEQAKELLAIGDESQDLLSYDTYQNVQTTTLNNDVILDDVSTDTDANSESISSSKVSSSLGTNFANADNAIEIKNLVDRKVQKAQKMLAKQSSKRSNGELGNLLMIVLIVILILIALTILADFLGPFSWVLSLLLLILLIYFILKVIGAI